MINTVLVTQDGVFFLKSTDATEKSKGGDFLAADLTVVLQDIGPEKVTLIVMDGAAPCLTCMNILKAKFPHIQMQRCATHGCSLIGKDLSAVLFIKQALKGGAVLTTLICSHAHIREALFNAHTNQLMKPSPTRFMGLFLVLIAIQKDKTKFMSVWTSLEMKKWAQKQKKRSKRRRGEGGSTTAEAEQREQDAADVR